MEARHPWMPWRGEPSITRTAWRVCRRWAMAIPFLFFPVLFIVDENVQTTISPVLPGMLGVLLLWLAAPFVAMEAWVRWGRRAEWQVHRQDQASKYALGASVVWFVAWMVLA